MYTRSTAYICQTGNMIEVCKILNRYYLNQNSQAVKKESGPQKGQKRCEIQGGGQEMTVMVG